MLTALLAMTLAAPPPTPRPPQAPPAWPAVVATSPTAAATAYTIPQGYHAHRTTDGRWVVHHDSNHGNAAAHAGVPHPWPKAAVAGQVIYFQSPSCPNGRCPTPRSFR